MALHLNVSHWAAEKPWSWQNITLRTSLWLWVFWRIWMWPIRFWNVWCQTRCRVWPGNMPVWIFINIVITNIQNLSGYWYEYNYSCIFNFEYFQLLSKLVICDNIYSFLVKRPSHYWRKDWVLNMNSMILSKKDWNFNMMNVKERTDLQFQWFEEQNSVRFIGILAYISERTRNSK